MKTILYYISEHGLGHLTRSIAIIRELQNHANIMIRNSSFGSVPYSPYLNQRIATGRR